MRWHRSEGLQRKMRESEVSLILLKTKCRENIKSWMSKTMKLKSTNSSYTVFLKLHLVMGENFLFFFSPKFQQVFDSLAFQCFFFQVSERAAQKITCKTRHIANTIYARITPLKCKQIPWVFLPSPLITDNLHTLHPYANHLKQKSYAQILRAL